MSRVLVSFLAAACIFPSLGIRGFSVVESVVAAAEEAEMVVELAGDWKVRVAHTAAGVMAAGTFVVAPPDIVEVLNEKIPTLPLFNSTVPGWVKGVALKEV